MKQKRDSKKNSKNWILVSKFSREVMMILLLFIYYIQPMVYIQSVSAAFMTDYNQRGVFHNKKVTKFCLPSLNVVCGHSETSFDRNCVTYYYFTNCKNKMKKLKDRSGIILYSSSTLRNNDMYNDEYISDGEMDDYKEDDGGSSKQFSSNSSSSSSDDDESNTDIDVSLDDISDEEALLACHSYLLRRKRLPWKAHERRKTMLEKSRNQSGVGYFWDDPDELVFLRKNKNIISSSLTTKNSDKYYEDELYYNKPKSEDDFVIGPGSRRGGFHGNDPLLIQHYNDPFDSNHINNDDLFRDIFQEERDETIDDDDTGDFFSIHPLHPSSAHVRRSEAKKRLFQDKEWKQRWYQRRWGNSNSSNNRKHNDEQKLVKAIPANILRSSEFATLSEDEIEQAIITYVMANRRRRQTFQDKYERKQDKNRQQKQQQPWLDSATSTSYNEHVGNQLQSNETENSQNFTNLDENQDSTFATNNASTVTPFTILSLQENNRDNSNLNDHNNEWDSKSFDESNPHNNEDENNQTIENALREAQRKRSERAKKAYQTRLKNLSKVENKKIKMASTKYLDNTSSSKLPKSPRPNKSLTQKTKHKQLTTRRDFSQNKVPKTAIDRVGQCVLLSSQRGKKHMQYPNPTDIVSILKPLRLGRRKSLLQQILDTFFGLRGKCVPDIMSTSQKGNDDSEKIEMEEKIATIIYEKDTRSDKYKSAVKYIFDKFDEAEKMKDDGYPVKFKFATKCTNNELGLFVLYLLNKIK